MSELADAVRLKQENDLAQFMHDYQLDSYQAALANNDGISGAANGAEESKNPAAS